MKDEELARLEALCAAATPGWESMRQCRVILVHGNAGEERPIGELPENDVEFAVAARDAVPALLAEVAFLRALLADAALDGYQGERYARALREIAASSRVTGERLRQLAADALEPPSPGAPANVAGGQMTSVPLVPCRHCSGRGYWVSDYDNTLIDCGLCHGTGEEA